MIEDPSTVQRATHLLWVAHNLRRVSSRTTNIAERVIYLVTGSAYLVTGRQWNKF